ncbi:MAG: septal ring lytic transglycosylase RlpA family protein [Ginsengibacter sp.]
MKIIFPFLNLVLVFFLFQSSFAQQKHGVIKKTYRNISHKKPVVKYGLASYYADKFHAHRTANGEKYNHSKNTAACNVFPINTRIRVTNLSNQRSLILKINDW